MKRNLLNMLIGWIKMSDKIIKDFINKTLWEFYAMINEYLEYIFNLPSTINRIITYYALGIQEDEPYKRYIMFNNTIVKEYKIVW